MRATARLAAIMSLALLASASVAQVFPTPSAETPRSQTVTWTPDQPIVLTALPETTLTVMLEPGEAIQRATLSGSRAWEVNISAETDSFQIAPQLGAAPASLAIESDRRNYRFTLEADSGLMAAYLVRLEFSGEPQDLDRVTTTIPENLDWSYRLRGSRTVRPLSVRDNGEKTVIEYAPGQSLPAVFAIGPGGDEEVVDGHMRGDFFVIDRVHAELVFRIDRKRATAKRNRRRDSER